MAASRRLGVLAIMMVVAEPAWAHHVMGGKLPQTFLQGLLSGFGHPVIGIDHLAAIVGVGILAALAGRSAAVVLAFSVAVIAGVGLPLAKVDLPASELFVGLTTLLIGALVIALPPDDVGRIAVEDPVSDCLFHDPDQDGQAVLHGRAAGASASGHSHHRESRRLDQRA